jgi:hypothetical protein
MSVDSLIAQWGVACSTQRPTTTRDSTGGIINTYTTAISAVTVYIQQGGGSEGETLGAQRNSLSATGYTTLGLDIRPQDRLFVGTTFWDIQEVRTPDERTYIDGLAHMRLSLTRILPL